MSFELRIKLLVVVCIHRKINAKRHIFFSTGFVTSEACSVLIPPEGTKCGQLDFQLNTQVVKEFLSLGA